MAAVFPKAVRCLSLVGIYIPLLQRSVPSLSPHAFLYLQEKGREYLDCVLGAVHINIFASNFIMFCVILLIKIRILDAETSLLLEDLDIYCILLSETQREKFT